MEDTVDSYEAQSEELSPDKAQKAKSASCPLGMPSLIQQLRISDCSC
jgi:hypothetical protein